MKKETKKLIAAGIVMALSCGAWGSVSAEDCIRVTQGSESKTITGTDIVFDSNFAHGKHPVCLDKSA